MMWIPKLRYPATSGTQLTLTRPMRHWSQPMDSVGGFRKSASGTARASYTIRRDRLLQLILRFDEAENAAIRAFIEWAQDNPNTGFDFWPDVAVVGTLFVCYLESPVVGERWEPQRNQDFASDLEASIVLRRTNGSAFDLSWYPD